MWFGYLAVGDGQGGLVCCNSWGCKESDTTEPLNWTDWMTVDKKYVYPFLILENSRPLCPWGPLDFLSTYLGIDSLVHYQPLESTQTHVHWVSDAIQPSHLLLSPKRPGTESLYLLSSSMFIWSSQNKHWPFVYPTICQNAICPTNWKLGKNGKLLQDLI